MKGIMRKLATLLSVIIIINTVFTGTAMPVKAEEVNASVTFTYSSTDLSYGEVQWKMGDGDWHTQQENGTENADRLRIRLSNGGQLSNRTCLRINGADILGESLDALTSDDGFELTAGGQYAFEDIEFISGGDGPQNPGDNQQGPGPGEIQINVNNSQNGRIEYKIGDGEWIEANGIPYTLRKDVELSGVSDGTTIYLKATPNQDQSIDSHEGQNRIRYDNEDYNIAADDLLEGTPIIGSYDSSKSYMVNLAFEGNGGNGQQDPGREPITDPIEISISVSEDSFVEGFFDRESPVRVDGYDVVNGKVTVNKSETHVIEVQINFGSGLSEFIVNDNACEFASGKDDTYSVQVAEADSYSIKLEQGESDVATIVWSYDSKRGDDAYVEHGRVELVSVYRNGDYIDIDEENNGISVSEDGGDLFLKKGDDVVLKLIPDYGYQLTKVEINDNESFEPEEDVSTFKISNLQGNIHFKGVFQSAEDEIINNCKAVGDIHIGDGQNAAASGNLRLTVSGNSVADMDFSSVSGNSVPVVSVDISLDNIVSMGEDADDYWESSISSFDKPVILGMKLDFDQLSEGEEYGVIREHDGKLELLNVRNNYEDGSIEFETNKFSTYTIVKKPQFEQGELVWTFDVNGEDMTFDPESLNKYDNDRISGEASLVYFGIVNNQGEIEPLDLVNEENNISVKYSDNDGLSWSDANISEAFSMWDLPGEADVRIKPAYSYDEELDGDSPVPGYYEIAFCRNGIFKIENEANSLIANTHEGLISLTQDSHEGYYFNTYTFDDEDTFSIVPSEAVKYYNIFVKDRFGYSKADNNWEFFSVSDSNLCIHYIDDEVSDPYQWAESKIELGTNFSFTDASKIQVNDSATSYAEVYIAYAFDNEEGKEELRVDRYDVIYKTIGVRDDDGKRIQLNEYTNDMAFECYAISDIEYRENTVDYFIDKELYVSYGKTMAEAIELMENKKETDENLDSFKYLLVRPKVVMNNRDAVDYSKEPQYISTPDNIEGVVITCQEMDYVVRVKNDYDTWYISPGEFNAWLCSADTENGEKYYVQKNHFSNDFFEVNADFEKREFSLASGTPVTFEEYNKPQTVVIEYQLPELHVDATTEIHLVGSFLEYDNDQPSIFMNIPENSGIVSVINGEEFTSDDLGKTYTKDTMYHSWANGDVKSTYTVKVDKLETKNTFNNDEGSILESATIDTDADTLLAGMENSLTSEEQQLVQAGKNITFSSIITAEDSSNSSSLEESTMDYQDVEAQYFDVELSYHVGFGEAEEKPVKETDEEITFTLKPEDGFIVDGFEYLVLRDHEGQVDIVKSTVNKDGTISFESGLFSAYALVKVPPTYSIKYVLNGGINAEDNPVSYTSKSNADISIGEPTKTGYTFAGWYSDSKMTVPCNKIKVGSSGDITLYAKWIVNSYNVMFDGNGATTGTMANLMGKVYDTKYVLNPNAYSRPGYRFISWNTKADGTGTEYYNKATVSNLTTDSEATVTLYAQWELLGYTITYNLGGGINNLKNPKVYDIETDTIVLLDPVKDGFTFEGWYADSKFKNQVTEIAAGTTGNKTVYAKWTVHKYSVEFIGNGATSGTMKALADKSCGSKFALTANAYKMTGYDFAGWNTEADGSGASYTNKQKVENLAVENGAIVALYAQWTPTVYKITYSLNGGTNNQDNPATYNIETLGVALKGPERAGAKFEGWYSDSKFKNQITEIAAGTTGNKTVYAKWTVYKYSVVFDGNGATNGTMKALTNKSCGSKFALTANAYKKSNYDFAGWNTEADGSGILYTNKQKVENISTEDGATVTLYAQWTPTVYKITYNLNGGTNNQDNPATYNIVTDTITLGNPSRAGAEFKGWYSDSKFKNQVTEIAAGTTGNKTVYAKWTVYKYSVVFDGNGATNGTMKALTNKSCGSKFALTANAYKKSNYDFAGWNTKADGSGISYTNKQKVENVSTEDGATVTLYAQWTPTVYKISYNLNGGTNNQDNPATYNIVTDTITLGNPSRAGAEFKGWYSDSKFKNQVTEIAAGTTGNKTVYAKWTVYKYNVKYDGNGATSGSMKALTNKSCGSKFALTANAYKKSNYDFAGWNTKADGSGISFTNKQKVENLSTIDGSTVTLYAQWTPTVYKITYKLNGGVNHSFNGEAYSTGMNNYYLFSPTREGYTFAGWYSDAKFTKPVRTINKNEKGNKVFYAKWNPIQYTVKFDGNGADSGSMSAMASRHYDVKYNLLYNGFKKSGYTFAGWNTEADGSGKSFDNQAVISNLTAENGAVVTLYAQWIENN